MDYLAGRNRAQEDLITAFQHILPALAALVQHWFTLLRIQATNSDVLLRLSLLSPDQTFNGFPRRIPRQLPHDLPRAAAPTVTQPAFQQLARPFNNYPLCGYYTLPRQSPEWRPPQVPEGAGSKPLFIWFPPGRLPSFPLCSLWTQGTFCRPPGVNVDSMLPRPPPLPPHRPSAGPSLSGLASFIFDSVS